MSYKIWNIFIAKNLMKLKIKNNWSCVLGILGKISQTLGINYVFGIAEKNVWWWDEGYVLFWGAKFYSNAKFLKGLGQAMTKKNDFWKIK